MRLSFLNTEENTEEHNAGSEFLAFTVKASASVLGESLLGDTFLEKDEKAKLWGNYRGTRYMIVSQTGEYMTLSKTLTGATIQVSSCNVSDVSTDSTTREVICPGDNQCRRDGLKQGPKCSPIRPSEGLLRYPHPI